MADTITLKRTPIVAVMGHVDHGKTSLLDAIRGTNVQAGEEGGITQNTRAHQITFNNQKVTFIDTPGHEAFSEMRSRGASVTDIVLLVVAADDGVLPQTKESIEFAKKTNTPILVAINKIDLPGADSAKIKNQLSQNDVLVEEYGGDVQVFEVSALKKEGINELLEGILLQAEVMELKKTKNDNGKAFSVVLESKLDSNLGPIALTIVKAGNFEVGDVVIANEKFSNIRAILDERQKNIKVAEEGDPVWLVGLNEVPPTGAIMYYANNDAEAKNIISNIKVNEVEEVEAARIESEEGEEEDSDLSLLATMISEKQVVDDIVKINVIVKTDSQGTLEAVLNELDKLGDEDSEINVIESGTGAITRKDILTASTAKGIVIGFQVELPSHLAEVVKEEGVIVRTYKVIYDLIDELGDALEGMLEPEEYEEEIARAKIKQVFELSDKSKVAGSEVIDGKVIKGYKVWIERDGEEIGRGKISSLKQNKNEVKEITKGKECGIIIDPPVEIEEGDEIVLYKTVKS